MKRGPKVKANKVHRLHGGKTHGELKVKKIPKLWNVPKDMKKDGRIFWKSIGNILIEHDVLTELDRYPFEIMSRLYQQIKDTQVILDHDGLVIDGDKGTLKRHPAAMIQTKAISEFRQLAAEFGLFPSSRERLGVNLMDDVDPTKDFLFGD